jgi:tyrosine-protein phosphatase SIW14
MFFSSSTRTFLFIAGLPVFAGSPAVQGIENFYKVGEHVYRGAQPTDAGFSYLAKIGVKMVIDLREHDERSIAEQRTVTASGMQYVNVPMTGLTPPTEAEISKILALLEDETSGSVFVHCKQGVDRTGTVIAAYRIDHDRWDNARALSEAKSAGIHLFQKPRKDWIQRFHPLTVEAKGIAKPAEASGVKTASTATDAAQNSALVPAAAPADANR